MGITEIPRMRILMITIAINILATAMVMGIISLIYTLVGIILVVGIRLHTIVMITGIEL